MKTLKLTVIAISFWGSSAFAVALSDSRGESLDQRQLISSWTAQLNYYFPSLQVHVTANLADPQSVQEVLLELEALHHLLEGKADLPHGALKVLACNRAVCDGGGGGGKCTTCN